VHGQGAATILSLRAHLAARFVLADVLQERHDLLAQRSVV
jgi:hypothetical protein